MNLQSRRHQKKVEAEPSAIFLPEELIAEVLSFLPVKSLTRFKCVSKSYKTLISDCKFIKLHLDRFSQKADRTLLSSIDYWNGKSVTFTSIHMLKNPPNNITTVVKYPCHLLDDNDVSFVVGSCNGLLCLCGYSYACVKRGYSEWLFHFWNPATRTMSNKLGSFRESIDYRCSPSNFTLGYDKSKDTFKLVCFAPNSTNIRILSLTDNIWRNIQNSPVAYYYKFKGTKPVHLIGSVNWLAIHSYFDSDNYGNYDRKNIAIEQFMIISLDLDTETHNKLLPPQGFNEVPFVVPNLSVLKDCLCFFHDLKQTHLVIWQMKEFGVEQSWTQLLKVSYHNLQKDYQFNDQLKFCLDFNDISEFHLIPVYLSEQNDTLLLINNLKRRAILFNWRDNRTKMVNKLQWSDPTLDYVESLFSYC